MGTSKVDGDFAGQCNYRSARNELKGSWHGLASHHRVVPFHQCDFVIGSRSDRMNLDRDFSAQLFAKQLLQPRASQLASLYFVAGIDQDVSGSRGDVVGFHLVSP
jgi:hypothetical protein